MSKGRIKAGFQAEDDYDWIKLIPVERKIYKDLEYILKKAPRKAADGFRVERWRKDSRITPLRGRFKPLSRQWCHLEKEHTWREKKSSVTFKNVTSAMSIR